MLAASPSSSRSERTTWANQDLNKQHRHILHSGTNVIKCCAGARRFRCMSGGAMDGQIFCARVK